MRFNIIYIIRISGYGPSPWMRMLYAHSFLSPIGFHMPGTSRSSRSKAVNLTIDPDVIGQDPENLWANSPTDA